MNTFLETAELVHNDHQEEKIHLTRLKLFSSF